MIRTGIYNISKLKSASLRDFLNKEKNISINIYNELLNIKEVNIYDKYSEIVLNRFNTKGNAIKRTYRNRFNAFDDQSVTQLKKHFKSGDIRMHDMAISDGRASLYLLKNLLSNFSDINYFGSDLAISYRKYFISDSSFVITDELQEIIEITVPPFVWNYARKEGSMYFINNILKEFYRKSIEKRLKNSTLKEFDRIYLVDREFNSLVKDNSKLKLGNHDLFSTSKSKFNVIRVMNILHYGYFKDDQIRTVLEKIFWSLEVGGLFIEGSNEDAGSPVEGAIFIKTEIGFALLESAECPSRILSAVLSYKKISECA